MSFTTSGLAIAKAKKVLEIRRDLFFAHLELQQAMGGLYPYSLDEYISEMECEYPTHGEISDNVAKGLIKIMEERVEH